MSWLLAYVVCSSGCLLVCAPSSPSSLPFSLGNCKFALCVSESDSVLHITFVCIIFRFHIQVILLVYNVCPPLTYFTSVIFSRCIHVAAGGRISFFMAEYPIPLYMCVLYVNMNAHTHAILIQSSLDGALGLFLVFVIVNSAAVNVGAVYLFKLTFPFFSDICPGVELLGHMVVLFLVSCGTSRPLSIVATRIYIPTSSAQEFPFSSPRGMHRKVRWLSP